jgi:hypothetical protein
LFSFYKTICDKFFIDKPIANNNAIHDRKVKVLVGLRFLQQAIPLILWRSCLVLAKKLAKGSASSFLIKFLEWFTSHHCTEYIHLPHTKEEIEHVEGLYHVNGFPGCMDSADGVHIPWEMSPAGIHSRCKGKEGYPTIVVNVASSHTRHVMAVLGLFMALTITRQWYNKMMLFMK